MQLNKSGCLCVKAKLYFNITKNTEFFLKNLIYTKYCVFLGSTYLLKQDQTHQGFYRLEQDSTWYGCRQTQT